MDPSLSFQLNGSHIDFVSKNASEVASSYPYTSLDRYFFQPHQMVAMLNLSFPSHTNVTLSVSMDVIVNSDYEYFDFLYWVDKDDCSFDYPNQTITFNADLTEQLDGAKQC